MPRPKKEIAKKEDVSPTVYSEYVHGKSIADIADEYGVSTEKVLAIIATIEQNRSPETT